MNNMQKAFKKKGACGLADGGRPNKIEVTQAPLSGTGFVRNDQTGSIATFNNGTGAMPGGFSRNNQSGVTTKFNGKRKGMADGGRPNPHMLGSGMAARAGLALGGRGRQIEGAIEAATGAAPMATPTAPTGGGLSARRDNAMPPAHMFAAQRRGMADGGGLKRKPHGGEVEGPGGPTDDEAGVFALSNDEYVLPADTVEAMGGAEALDQIRDATHEFVDESNRPRGLANGGPAGPAEPNWFQKQRAAAATERRAASEVKAGTANPDMQALYAKNQATLNNPEVMNPLAEVPGIGLASRTVSAGAAKAPGMVGGALEGLRAGANKVTNFFANKAAAPVVASAAPTTGKVLPGTVSGGFTNAERVAATPASYATGGLVRPGAATSQLASGQMPTAGRIAANALVTGALGSDNAVSATATPPPIATPAPAPGGAAPAISKGLGASRFTADNDALLREQAGRAAASYNQGIESPTNLGYADPEGARTFYENRTASEFSPEMVGIVNKGIRARQNTAGSVGDDNARLAADGYGDVTKSVGKDGRVSYGNGSPNPSLGDGKALSGRRANDAANLQEGQARAANDRAVLDGLIQDRVARDTGFEKGAAAEATVRLEQSKVAGAERVGLAKAQTDMAKAGLDQKNSDRTFGLAQRAAQREDGKLLRARQDTALANAGIRRLDAEGNVTPEYQAFSTGVQEEFLKLAGNNGPIPTLDDLSEGDQQILIRAAKDKKALEPGFWEQAYLKYMKQTPYVQTDGLTRGAPQAGTYSEGFLRDTVKDGNGAPLAVPGGLSYEQQQRMRGAQ